MITAEIYIASKVKHRHTISVEKMVKHALQIFVHVTFISLNALVTTYNKRYSKLPFSLRPTVVHIELTQNVCGFFST